MEGIIMTLFIITTIFNLLAIICFFTLIKNVSKTLYLMEGVSKLLIKHFKKEPESV
jgi:hypothetical protein